MDSSLANIIYLTRNGVLEPLGQSQVLAYLRGLSKSYKITLITYEKPEDWADSVRWERVEDECQRLGIRWRPQRFRRFPRLMASSLSIIQMFLVVLLEIKRDKVRLVHARSYIPAVVALAVKRLTGVPFLFDMRALWPEELITAGRLRRGSIVHLAVVTAERLCIAGAAGVVSLTDAAVEHLRQEYKHELAEQRMVVIPTCADLNRFKPSSSTSSRLRIHGCIGTVLSGWFRLDWLAEWFSVVAETYPEARFELITRDDPDRVREALDSKGGLGDRLSIRASTPEAMPEALQGHDLSVMFFTEGLSKLGSSPTRMGEVLGCGLPIVANAGVGDVERILTENRVGVLVQGSGLLQMKEALDELERLMADPKLAIRCRATAETLYSLESGTEAYRKLYSDVLET